MVHPTLVGKGGFFELTVVFQSHQKTLRFGAKLKNFQKNTELQQKNCLKKLKIPKKLRKKFFLKFSFTC